MLQTIEATIGENGDIRLAEPVKLAGRRRALVTILDEQPPVDAEWEAEQRAIGQAGLKLAAKVLEPEDFSDWPSYPGKPSQRNKNK